MKVSKGTMRRPTPRSEVAPAPAFDLVGRGMAQWRRQRPDIDCSGKAVIGRIVHLQETILRAVNAALAFGKRGLPGGSSLARLLAGVRQKKSLAYG